MMLLLCREVKSVYNFVVVAVDGGVDVQLKNTADVIINVQDVNDNPPVVHNGGVTLYIPQDLLNGKIFK